MLLLLFGEVDRRLQNPYSVHGLNKHNAADETDLRLHWPVVAQTVKN